MQKSVVKKCLNKTVLQIIAVICMAIDHVSIFAANIYLYYVMKFFGRITIIVMCYFVAEGYYKTRNLNRYIIRLGIFAAISQVPYYLYKFSANLPNSCTSLIISMFMNRNVIFTLFVGLSLLVIIKSDYSIIVKAVAAGAALWLVRCSDWGFYAVLWIVGFGVFRDSKKQQCKWLMAVLALKILTVAATVMMYVVQTGMLPYSMICGVMTYFGGFLALPLISLYNGEKGKGPKWGFYIFYPAHLIIITIVYMLMS